MYLRRVLCSGGCSGGGCGRPRPVNGSESGAVHPLPACEVCWQPAPRSILAAAPWLCHSGRGLRMASLIPMRRRIGVQPVSLLDPNSCFVSAAYSDLFCNCLIDLGHSTTVISAWGRHQKSRVNFPQVRHHIRTANLLTRTYRKCG